MSFFFATNTDHPSLTPDDRIAATAIRKRGVQLDALVWSETEPEALPPSSVVVIRSCWDYHLQPQLFLNWIGRLEKAGVRIINSPAVLRWNLHKGYLRKLEENGIDIIPTMLLPRGSARVGLDHLLREAGWKEAVVKPAISLSAHETWRVSAAEAERHQIRFSNLRTKQDLLVQGYVPEIVAVGEWSLVFIRGEYTHAVLKRAASGDFRVQQEHGGSFESATPPDWMVGHARVILSKLPEMPMYARIDGVEEKYRFLLMEVECIDPVLFFEQDKTATD